MKRFLLVSLPALLILFIPTTYLLQEGTAGRACTTCHEMATNFDRWHQSTHRGIKCTACHDSNIVANAGRVMAHTNGEVPDRIHLSAHDVSGILERCAGCHRQEFAEWKSGPHGIAYSKIFLDAKTNKASLLADDCLRCHGAHFDGGIRDLVTPVDTRGPWKFRDAQFAAEPAIPCLSCHQMHREGRPVERAGAPRKTPLPSVAFFDRRGGAHVGLALLPLPAMREGDRAVRMSLDQRQALCYQCHAPRADFQVGSGDDRTPIGVHEGISCNACHLRHGQSATASCSTCHPKMSNCGLDVEKMDTTFTNKHSSHNIHTVKCSECHTKGVPPRRTRSSPAERRS